MKMENIDPFTSDIMNNSKLELTNANFENLLMNKIIKHQRKQVFIHNIKLFILIFVSLDSIIFAVLKLMNIRMADIALKIISFSHTVLFTKYSMFIYLIVIALLAIKVLSGTQYSKIQVK